MKTIMNIRLSLSLVSYVTFLLTCPSMAQVSQDGKIELTGTDYAQWSTMRTDDISDDGLWVSYSNSFQNGIDTLFIREANGKRSYSFSGCFRGRFINRNNFACIDTESTLHLLELTRGRKTAVPAVSDFHIAGGEQLIITAGTSTGDTFQLKLWGINGKPLQAIENVTAYAISPQGTKLVYAYKVGIAHYAALIDLTGKLKQTLIPVSSDFGYGHFEWQPNGQSVAFFKKAGSAPDAYCCIYRYRLIDNMLKQLDLDGKTALNGMTFTDIGILRLKASEDGDKVFFAMRPSNPITEDRIVQIWNANDKELYPIERQIMRWKNIPKLAVWWPDTGDCRLLSGETFPHAMVVGRGRFALLANPNAAAPQFKLDNDKDYYIEEIATGHRSLLLRSQPGEMSQFRQSPDGKFISYYSNGNWWAYDMITGTHHNLTNDMDVKWESSFLEYTLELGPYGSPGWTKDSKALIVYDADDIWLLPLVGKPRRITDGYEKNIRFRIARDTGAELYGDYKPTGSDGVNLSSATVLEARGYDGATGYFSLNGKYGTSPLAYNASCIEQFRKAAATDAIIYTEQRFDLSPRIMLHAGRRTGVIAESNLQQDKFFWARSEMVYFKNSSGTSLKAALYYPSNYIEGKKYPMIVNIYESLSKDLHRYVNPTTNSPEGINITRLTSQGYFFLAPDIAYIEGEVGASALDCTLSAVKAVLDKGAVEKGSVGIIGHSFGGYETDFIITQTDFFAAAVSGAAIPDVQGWYFNISESLGKEDMWRFEHQQFRMGKSFFEMKETYLRNSALNNAAGVTTPLLSWAGGKDNTVPVQQSLSFYLALRRLGKKHILLVYPNAGHSLRDVQQQQDLSQRILDWFGYFLKGEKAKEWIATGIGRHY
jgi:dipeptidyl aminopeptidase/acylaminoacyl peptidase